MSRSEAPPRLPEDLRAAGLVLDRGHVGEVDRLLEITESEAARQLLAAWRAAPEFEFVVVCGKLHAKGGAVFGGLARTQADAMTLFAVTTNRFDRLAKRAGGFSSAWVLLLDADRLEPFRSLAATLQTAQASA